MHEGLVQAWLGEGLFGRTWLLSNARKMCANARWQLENKTREDENMFVETKCYSGAVCRYHKYVPRREGAVTRA